MRFTLAVVIAGLLPIAVAAQRWGGPAGRTAPVRTRATMRGAPVIHTFPVRPAAAPVRSGFRFRPGSPGRTLQMSPQWRRGFRHGHFRFNFGQYPFGVHPLNRCFSDAFFDPYFCTRQPTQFSSFAPLVYPFYSAPYAYAYDNSPEDYSAAGEQQLARARARASDLTAQIEQLREELQDLREQQAAKTSAGAPPAPAARVKEEPATPTTLVFRDGRRSEVENYAIVGNTLWVFSQQRRKKIPVSELDLEATQQANEERGVDFAVPPRSEK